MGLRSLRREGRRKRGVKRRKIMREGRRKVREMREKKNKELLIFLAFGTVQCQF